MIQPLKKYIKKYQNNIAMEVWGETGEKVESRYSHNSYGF